MKHIVILIFRPRQQYAGHGRSRLAGGGGDQQPRRRRRARVLPPAAALPPPSSRTATTPRGDAFDAALARAIDTHRPDLLGAGRFHAPYSPRASCSATRAAANIHPSLLPAFPGLDTHARALAAGVKLHGCSVHFVTAQLDHGPIVIQAAVPCLPGDDEARLAARVLAQEHRVYRRPRVWFLEGKLVIEKRGGARLTGSATTVVRAVTRYRAFYETRGYIPSCSPNSGAVSII